MVAMILDSLLEERLRAERAAWGADHHDEVWEGVYMMTPLPNNEHQLLVGRLTRVLDEIVTDGALGQVLPGANVSDRVDDWKHNYRVPDVVVFLNDTQAVNHDTFWHGGPDFAIEIVSHQDKSREKLEFYGRVGTRELLLIDRDPWRLELYRLRDQGLHLAASATADDGSSIASHILPLQVSLQAAADRPRMLVSHSDRTWTI
jgi:Uma2 family endonuclease